MPNPNDLHEMKRLREMGWTVSQIADHLGVSKRTVQRRSDPRALEAERARCRIRQARQREEEKHGLHKLNLDLPNGNEHRPSDDILKARDERLSKPYRDLTGELLNDPRVGQSALDRKLERAGA